MRADEGGWQKPLVDEHGPESVGHTVRRNAAIETRHQPDPTVFEWPDHRADVSRPHAHVAVSDDERVVLGVADEIGEVADLEFVPIVRLSATSFSSRPGNSCLRRSTTGTAGS